MHPLKLKKNHALKILIFVCKTKRLYAMYTRHKLDYYSYFCNFRVLPPATSGHKIMQLSHCPK